MSDEGQHRRVPGHLPILEDRGSATRDLRTRAELTAKGFTQLGEAKALLRHGDSLEPLYSTSEARLMRDALWALPAPPAGGTSAQGAARGGGAPAPSQPQRRRSHIPLKAPGGEHPGRTGDPQRWLLEELWREGFVVLDTETTGLSTRDEIIEIAVIDSDGSTLCETRVFPQSGHVPAASTRVHGYTLEDLRGAPSWPEVHAELERLLAGRRVFAWNAPFDERMVLQSSRLWRLETELRGFECAMRAYSTFRRAPGSLRLQRVALVEGVLTGEQSHTSLADARLTLAVLQRLRSTPGGRP